VADFAEAVLGSLLQHSPLQQRPVLNYSFQLHRVANAHAQDMALHDYFSHTRWDDITANERVREGGFSLPSHYPEVGNNVESLAAGIFNEVAVWAGLLRSPGHRAHLLGEGEFFRAQNWYGVGVAHNSESRYQIYWVILIAQGDYTSGE
jgi:uncharacterized protein YkwD